MTRTRTRSDQLRDPVAAVEHLQYLTVSRYGPILMSHLLPMVESLFTVAVAHNLCDPLPRSVTVADVFDYLGTLDPTDRAAAETLPALMRSRRAAS